MSEAKQEILDRIRNALRSGTVNPVASYAALNRQYTQLFPDTHEEKIHLFIDRLHDYNATVYRCPVAELPATISEALTARQKHRILVPPAFPQQWLPPNFEFIPDNDAMTYQQIDGSDGVLTTCALAIALTGTIVLRHSMEEGRRALTLIPDYHLCLVREEQIAGTVPEGIRSMSDFARAPITTIAGPSATSDIEMTRIKGVHGPRTLDVILIGRSASSEQ